MCEAGLVALGICLTACQSAHRGPQQYKPHAQTTKPGCVCKKNLDKGYATIVCQPVDQDVVAGHPAVFSVDATGKNLIYQWYFRGEDVNGMRVEAAVDSAQGGQTAAIKIPNVDPTMGGSYWCDIHSTGDWGAPVTTRTRDAQLGIKTDPPSLPAGQVQSFLGQQGPFAPGSQGTVCNSGTCGYVNFQNNGNGYDPDPGLTKGRVKIHVDGNPNRLNSDYCLMWYDDLGGMGCATDDQTPPKDQKLFNINANRLYVFTVFFKTGKCPGNPSAQAYMDLFFDP